MMDHAQATLPQDSTGFASIQLEMGYLPHTSFDWDRPIGLQSVHERLSHKEAQQYIKHLEQAWKVACKIIKKAQQSMEKQANKHWHEPDFDVGDSVWVTMKNWKTEQPSRKLDYQCEDLSIIYSSRNMPHHPFFGPYESPLKLTD